MTVDLCLRITGNQDRAIVDVMVMTHLEQKVAQVLEMGATAQGCCASKLDLLRLSRIFGAPA